MRTPAPAAVKVEPTPVAEPPMEAAVELEPELAVPSGDGSTRPARELTAGDELLLADRWVLIDEAVPHAEWHPATGRGRRWMQFAMADGSIVTEDYQALVVSRDALEQVAADAGVHDSADCGECDEQADAARDMDRADGLIGGEQR
jgi:hypothetical protein